MSDFYEVPQAVADAIADGMAPLKAFRQSSGRASHDVAVAAGLDPNRMAQLENAETFATCEELNALASVLSLPRDLLIGR